MAVSAYQHRVRSVVWTGAIAAVTITGALYGAGLKTKQEVKQAVEKKYEATPAEKIAILQMQRSALVTKRMGLEKKMHEIELRASGATRAQSMQGQERKRP